MEEKFWYFQPGWHSLYMVSQTHWNPNNPLFWFQRMDIGQCSKIHNLALRADYEAAVKKGKKYDYEVDVSTAWLLTLLARQCAY